MTNAWFRLYAEWLDDEKVQMLPEAMQRRLIGLFCLRCQKRTETLNETQIAFRLRISPSELAETKKVFLQQGFIDENWAVVNWSKRQFLSDCSTERVKRFRENKGLKRDETFHETHETENETAPEQNRTEQRQNRTDTHAPLVRRKDTRAGARKTSPDGDLCVSILQTWNDYCEPEFKRVEDTRTRRELLRTCIKRHHVTPTMIFEAIQNLKSGGGRAIGIPRATFDWLIRHDTIVETLDGVYGEATKPMQWGKHANA